MPLTREKILRAVSDALAFALGHAEQGLSEVRQMSVDAPGAMQSHSDTTKYQMGVVADGIAAGIAELKNTIREILALSVSDSPETLVLGSTAELVDKDGIRKLYFLFGSAGGTKFNVEGIDGTIITPASPIGQKLSGKARGEYVELREGAPAAIENIY